MILEKQLILTGATEVNAVLINDMGERYPVLLESLHNTVLFPELMNSGYKLEGLPYGFVKDGVRLADLPVENYNPTPQEEELMYNSIGIKLSQEELKNSVTLAEVPSVQLPPTNYTIFTRDEFLQYLDAHASVDSDADYMPLNYFVHPDARFSLSEYFSLTFKKYTDIIDKRRIMSLRKFHALIDTLLTINLNPNYTAQDVLDAYFAWGMDGLKCDIIATEHINATTMLTARVKGSISTPLTTNTVGFVDGAGNQIIADKYKTKNWTLVEDSAYLMSQQVPFRSTSEVRLATFSSPDSQVRTVLTTRDGWPITYTTNMLVMQLRTYPSIRVISPNNAIEYLPLHLALPTNKEALYEYSTINALASMLFDYRKPTIKVSSFDALTRSGCSARTALDYIVNELGVIKKSENFGGGAPSPQLSQQDMPKLNMEAVDEFVSGELAARLKRRPNEEDELALTFLEQIVDGEFNIDNVSTGIRLDMSQNVESTKRAITAIHEVLGIPLSDIYDKFRTINSSVTELEFSNGRLTYYMDVKPLRNAVNGYKSDLSSYDAERARDCNYFTFVTQVAKEVGDEERATRHVAIEFYKVNKSSAVQTELAKLKNAYVEKCMQMLTDMEQKKFLAMADRFAMIRFFEKALNGTLSWPANLGGTVETIPLEERYKLMKYCELKIESLPVYCMFAIDTSGRYPKMDGFCVNAFITEQYVIPRGDKPIHEVPFYALWYDYRKHPELWGKLTGLGVLKPDFIPWSTRPLTDYMLQRSLLTSDGPDSLEYYYKNALDEVTNWPNNKDFVHVKHPCEIMYPTLHPTCDDLGQDMDDLPVPRADKPKINVYTSRDIVAKDMIKHLEPEHATYKDDSYIKQFTGFNADILINVPNAIDMLPKGDFDNSITVFKGSNTIYCEEFKQSGPINFRNITTLDASKYHIVNIYDRYYFFCGTDGNIWEVKL